MSLFNVVQSHIKKFKEDLYTTTVAEIVSINYNGDYIQSVNVRPSIDTVFIDGDIKRKPVINNVPVVFPSGGGGIMSFPLQIGNTVVLVFNKEDLTQFLKSKTPDRPDTQRKFSLNDAIAIPCISTLTESLEPNKDNVEIKFKDSSIKILPSGDIEVESVNNITVNTLGDASVTATGTITVVSPTLVLDCADVAVSGSLRVSGDISTDSDVSTPSVASLNTHVHKDVQTGSSVSGVPLS